MHKFVSVFYIYIVAVILSLTVNVSWADELMPGSIDIHFHSHPQIKEHGTVSFDTDSAALNALSYLDEHGIAFAILMPPPMSTNHEGTYDFNEMRQLTAQNPSRLGFMAGGGYLNPIIQETDPEEVTPEVKAKFTKIARAILAAGARGFGELTALHLSMRRGHPFEATSPDHPLFLLLADIAAGQNVPIDLHMEAVPKELPVPSWIAKRGENNPDKLDANIDALERLLTHNRKTTIIWSHAGWDNTGQRVPELLRNLLAAHANLYMSIKLRSRRRDGPGIPMGRDGGLKQEWLTLFQEFPGRFLIGSDSHIFLKKRRKNRGGASRAAELLRQLPQDLAKSIGRDNAIRLFRLR